MSFRSILKRFVRDSGLGVVFVSDYLGISRAMYYKYDKGVSEPSFASAVGMIKKMGYKVSISLDLEFDSSVIDSKKKVGGALLYRRVALVEMERVMDVKKGWHRDHIVPISFCRKIGVEPEKASIVLNLQYLMPEDNMDKSSFVTDRAIGMLDALCEIWGVEVPSRETIDNHNRKVSSFNFDKDVTL